MHPILIVDDERDNLEALQRLVRNQYDVTITTSPFEALKLIQKNSYHVIVSDQRMPEMTGVELLEKAKHVSPASTRILLTGYTDIDSVIGAINRGNIYRYIAKPWDPEDLKLTLRQANDAFLLRQELEQKNIALAHSNAELQKAAQELKLLDQAKASFLSLISHELNTPLTVLSSFTELLNETKKTLSTDLQKAVSGVTTAAGRFQEIISEVLSYTKLESQPNFQMQLFDLGTEVKNLVAEWRKEAEKKHIQVKLKSFEPISVRCDPERMRLALRRLADDSIRNSPDKGEIHVTLGQEGDYGTVAIWRRGSVLSMEAFSPLVASGETLHHHRNLGLGLAMCRLIVEGHGGKVSVTSSEKDGTTVVLSLPK